MNVVIVNCFDTYESRVDLLYEFFTQNGDSVKVYTSNFRHFQKCERTDSPNGYFLLNTRPYKKNISFGRILSHMRFAKDVRQVIEKQIDDIDLLWVMIPPNSLAQKLSGLKKKFNKVKLVFDVIDVWPESMPFNGMENLPPIKYWKNLRNKNIQNADIVVTECLLFRKKIEECVQADKLANLYFAKKSSGVQAKDVTTNDVFELCYLGSINNIVDIDAIGKIITQLNKERHVILHVIGDGERREELLETAKASGASVEFHGTVYDERKKNEIFSRCHFGLNIMKDSVCVGLTMKSMDYFEAGLPMINNIHGDTWDIIEEQGFGVNWPFEVDKVVAMCDNNTVRKKEREYFENTFSDKAFYTSLKNIVKKIYQTEDDI